MLHQLARVVDALGPGHLADVDQAFDAVFELHEGAVAHDVDDFALDARCRPGTSSATFSHGLGVFCFRPRAIFSFSWSMCRILTSSSSSILTISLRVVDAAPAHVGDVQQAVDAAEVDERAEVGDVLDDALAELADFELREQLGLLLGSRCVFDQAAAADDDVAAGFVDLEDHALDRLADVVADVGRAADVDLAGGQEDVDADVDEQAALDLAGDHAGDDVAFVDGLHDLHPLFDLLGLALAEDDHAAVVERGRGRLRRLRPGRG